MSKNIFLVSYNNIPTRAFNTKEDAKAWIKKISKQYNVNISDFLTQEILMYI